MPEWVGELWRWFKAVLVWWFKTVGGSLVAVFQICYSLKYREAPPVISWCLLGFCFLIASFLAWRDERKKSLGKNRRAILTEVVDLVKKPSGEKYSWLAALIKHCDDFHDEKSVLWVRRELGKHHIDPFAILEVSVWRKSVQG
jgi:hypothetical protein